MFASAVWSCVLPNVSEAVEAFVLMHSVAVGRSRTRRKAILYTHFSFAFWTICRQNAFRRDYACYANRGSIRSGS